MKTIKEKINLKAFKKLMIYIRRRTHLSSSLHSHQDDGNELVLSTDLLFKEILKC